MTTIFREAREKLPITTGCILLSAALCAAVSVEQVALGEKAGEALSHWGAGPLPELWHGQWWRIFISAFHHGNFLHLVMNASALWFMGKLLEPRLGTVRFALFVVSSIAVTGVLQSFFGNAVGLSGFAFAEFGALLVLRQVDDEVAAEFNDQTVYFGIIFLFACIPLTLLEIVSIANVAHFAGLIYGWVAGNAFFSRSRWRTPVWGTFLVGHLLLIPAFYFVMHPDWDGRYHDMLAKVALDAKDYRETLRQSELAIQCDPELTRPWWFIAAIHFDEGRPLESWNALIRAIRVNPCFDDAIRLARHVWSRLPTMAAREQAVELLRETFGPEASQWERTLIAENENDPTALAQEGGAAHEELEQEPSATSLLPLGTLDDLPPRSRTLPAPQPDQAGSAEEGQQI